MADKDQRHIDRAAEEERQQKVTDAVNNIDWEAESAAARNEQAALAKAAAGGPAVIEDKPAKADKAEAK